MKLEKDLKSTVHDLLVRAGIPESQIEDNYNIAISDQGRFCSDLAVIDESSISAVFEIKACVQKKRINGLKQQLQKLGRLFILLKPNIRFYAVCNNEIAEVVTGNVELKWYPIEKCTSFIKRQLVDNIAWTISHYLRCITEAKRKLSEKFHTKHIVKFFYRGQNNCKANSNINGRSKEPELRPALFRQISGVREMGLHKKTTYYNEEEYLVNEAVRIFPSAFAMCKSDIDRLTVAQHYGIPTRLLDVTGNALVALYFAVFDGKEDCDGIVYVFPTFVEDFRMASSIGQDDKITIKGFHQGANKKLSKQPSLIFPSFQTQRQTVQDGAFYMIENTANPMRVCEFDKSRFERIIIPKEEKKRLQVQLEGECNIHYGTMFPESLDGSKAKIVKEAENRILIEAFNELKEDIKRM